MGKPVEAQNNKQIGVVILGGPVDWQILQQDETGHATIALHGTWSYNAEQYPAPGRPRVQARIVHGDSGATINPETDWQDARVMETGTWRLNFKRIPAGGLYRLETRLVPPGHTPSVWSPRGDMRHFIGVGDLWVIAGQSNSAGYGRAAVVDAPQLGVHLFRNSEQWSLAAHPLNESTSIAHTVNQEPTNPGHSPWLYFAKQVQQATGHPIGLVQTSMGGSPLIDWNPTAGPAPLWKNMKHCIAAVGGKVRGVLWYQGESDTGTDELVGGYGLQFIKMVGEWRKVLKNSELALVTVQLNRHLPEGDEDRDRRWSMVREQQRRLASHFYNLVVVPSIDLPLDDEVHISSQGNIQLGERAARAALNAFYGKSVQGLAPDLKSIRKAGKQVVELTFENVTSHFSTINPSAKPFIIEDEGGTVPIEGWSSTDHRIRVAIARPLQGKAVVHAGYGANPVSIPHDDARMLPLLAFYGVEVK